MSRTRAATTATVAAALAAAMACGCGLPDTEFFGEVPDVSGRPRHLRFCNSGEPEGLDPAVVSSTTAMKPVFALFDGLTDYDQNGLPEASLATRWDVSDDMRRFTFHLHDKGRWSNGRPITAHDFRYHVVRVLHPSTASVNADGLEPIKNALLFNNNAVRLVLRDTDTLRAGDVVEVLAVAGRTLADWNSGDSSAPDSNLRRGRAPLALRDLHAPASDAYATAPAGADVLIVELSGDPCGRAPTPGPTSTGTAATASTAGSRTPSSTSRRTPTSSTGSARARRARRPASRSPPPRPPPPIRRGPPSSCAAPTS